MIRTDQFTKAVFDAYLADQRIKTGDPQYTQNDAMRQIVREVLPEYVERVKQLRPDLYKEWEGIE